MGDQQKNWADSFVKLLEAVYRILKILLGDPRTRVPKLIIVAGLALLASPWWQPLIYSALDRWTDLDLTYVEQSEQAVSITGWVILCIGVALYLYVRPKQQQAEPNQEAGLLVARTAATLIVDLMRLLYVVASEEGRAANRERLDLFINMASNHLTELRSQSARSANLLPADLLNLSGEIESKCAWVFGQLNHQSDVTFDLRRCFDTMRDAASITFQFCECALSDTFPAIVREVDDAMAAVARPEAPNCAQTLRYRLAVQEHLIRDESSNVPKMGSIAFDVSKDGGVYYFVIDYRLLSSVVETER